MKNLVLFLLVNTYFQVWAQNPCSQWYFGSKLHMNFNTLNQDPIIDGFGKTMDEYIKTSSVSSNVNILFYTDGTSVWNAQHQVMPHGYLLRDSPMLFMYSNYIRQGTDSLNYFYYGYCSAYAINGYPITNCAGNVGTSTLVVPDPGSAFKYYVLSGINEINQNSLSTSCFSAQGLSFNYARPASLYYSKVNMNLNSGLGDVELSSKRTLIKNNSGAENVCAVKHGNNTNYWILRRE